MVLGLAVRWRVQTALHRWCTRYRGSASLAHPTAATSILKSMSPSSLHTPRTGTTCLAGHSGSTLIRAENTLLVSSFNFAGRVVEANHFAVDAGVAVLVEIQLEVEPWVRSSRNSAI
jgi:hypothetical protein